MFAITVRKDWGLENGTKFTMSPLGRSHNELAILASVFQVVTRYPNRDGTFQALVSQVLWKSLKKIGIDDKLPNLTNHFVETTLSKVSHSLCQSYCILLGCSNSGWELANRVDRLEDIRMNTLTLYQKESQVSRNSENQQSLFWVQLTFLYSRKAHSEMGLISDRMSTRFSGSTSNALSVTLAKKCFSL